MSTNHTNVNSQVRATDGWMQLLLKRGIETVFGVPGGPAAPLFDSILLQPGLQLVESRHESAAVFAAMGYYRATGKMAAVAFSAGPGLANAMSGITSAYFEQIPVLLLAGDVPWIVQGRRLIQSLGPEGLHAHQTFQAVTRGVFSISSIEESFAEMDQAIHRARQVGQEGPVLLLAPLHLASSTVSEAALTSSLHRPLIPEVSAQFEPTPEPVLSEILERLIQAKRPVVLAGATLGSEQRADLLKVCERHGIPFMTTPRGKGVLPEDHPLSLRNGGMAASWWARKYITEVDASLVLGTDLDDVSIGVTPPIRSDGTGYLAHVDLNPQVFARNLPVSRTVQQELSVFLSALRQVSEKRFAQAANAHSPATLREIKASSPFDQPDFQTDPKEPMAAHRVVADLQKALGPEGTLITDIGEHMLFGLHYWTSKSPKDFVIHLGLGAMGSGIGSSLGYAFANLKHGLGRKVVCLCGDGGIQMSSWELLVAVKTGIPLVTIIMNDGRYNMVKHGFQAMYQRQVLWDMPRVDFTLWGKSMGIASLQVDQPGQLTADLLAQLTSNWTKPALIDLRFDPETRIRGAGRNESIKQMSVVNEADSG